jgi:hypothetical protein
MPGPVDSRIKSTLKQDLTCYYSFDTINGVPGNSVPDDLGTGYPMATTVGDSVSAGKIGNTLNINPSYNAWVPYNQNFVLVPATDNYLSVSFWVYIQNVAGTNFLVAADSEVSQRQWRVQYIAGSGLYWAVFNNFSYGASIFISGVLSANTWYHVHCNYDRLAGTISGSCNNAVYTSASYTNGIATCNVPPLSIGYLPDYGSYGTFLIDELAIWKRNLTISERDAIYNNGNGISLKAII